MSCCSVAMLSGGALATTSPPTDANAQAPDGPPGPAYVTFEMQVTWASIISLQNMMTDLLNKKVKEIHLLISSTGGDVGAAVAVYNFLKGLSVELTTYNLGDVDSAAVIVFLAGRKRFCSPSSRFLFHQARMQIQNQTLSADDYKENIENLESDVTRMKLIYTSGTKIDEKKADYLLSRQNWVDPSTAMDLGVVDGIEPLRIPINASVEVLAVPD